MSVALSYFVIIVALSVSAGFREEIRSGIATAGGDVQLTSPTDGLISEQAPFHVSDTAVCALSLVEGVRSVHPVIYRPGIVKGPSEISGVLFKGIDGPLDSLRVSVPSTLAAQLRLSEGDRLQAYFIGEKVKVRNFTIASVYEGIMTAGANPVVFVGMDDMLRVCGWGRGDASAVEIKAARLWRTEAGLGQIAAVSMETMAKILPEDESLPVGSTSYHRFPQLFAWLDLIDFNVAIVLILMTIVAGFNMVSGLLIMLFRNIPTIGILKSLGMSSGGISAVFLMSASRVVLKGMAAGNAAGLGAMLLQGATHILKLDPANYFVDHVPVAIPWARIIAADAASYLVIMALLLIPCLFINRVDPARTVRAQ